MKRTALLTFGAIALSFSLSGTHALAEQVYKWVDEDGRIHYSDIKPNKSNVENVKIRGTKSQAAVGSPIDKAADLDTQKQAELEQKAEALQANAQQRENDERCQALRNNIKKMNEGSRVKISENGELRYLSPEEVAERKASYQKMLDESCSS